MYLVLSQINHKYTFKLTFYRTLHCNETKYLLIRYMNYDVTGLVFISFSLFTEYGVSRNCSLSIVHQIPMLIRFPRDLSIFKHFTRTANSIKRKPLKFLRFFFVTLETQRYFLFQVEKKK